MGLEHAVGYLFPRNTLILVLCYFYTIRNMFTSRTWLIVKIDSYTRIRYNLICNLIAALSIFDLKESCSQNK